MDIKFMMSRKLLYKVIAGILLIAITFIIYTGRQSVEDMFLLEPLENESIAQELPAEPEPEPLPEEEKFMVIDVSGEVMNPSICKLPDGARVYEAVEAAGGLTEYADTRNTNLAAPLDDGMKLYIPNKKDVAEEQKRMGESPGSRYINGNVALQASSALSTKNRLININTADSNELQKLTGVGPSTADKIITYRNEFGKFKNIEELMNVSGIGEKTFAKLKNAITTE
jgi:competence protein ComEA